MNCARCNTLLAKHEHAQGMRIAGRNVYPRSFCRDCLTPWPGGTPEAHERARTGKRDLAEIARIGETVAQWRDEHAPTAGGNGKPAA